MLTDGHAADESFLLGAGEEDGQRRAGRAAVELVEHGEARRRAGEVVAAAAEEFAVLEASFALIEHARRAGGDRPGDSDLDVVGDGAIVVILDPGFGDFAGGLTLRIEEAGFGSDDEVGFNPSSERGLEGVGPKHLLGDEAWVVHVGGEDPSRKRACARSAELDEQVSEAVGAEREIFTSCDKVGHEIHYARLCEGSRGDGAYGFQDRGVGGHTVVIPLPAEPRLLERVHGGAGILESGGLAHEGEFDGAGRAVALFGDDDFGDVGGLEIGFAHAVIVFAVEEHDDVGVLFDAA